MTRILVFQGILKSDSSTFEYPCDYNKEEARLRYLSSETRVTPPIVDIWENVEESALVMEASKVFGKHDSLWVSLW